MAIEEADAGNVPEAKSGGFKKLLTIVLLLLVAVSASIAAVLYITGAKADTPAAKTAAAADQALPKPLYLSLDPPLVVNFQRHGQVSYLQVGIDVMSRRQSVLDQIKANMPVVRNDLILLFSSQQYDTLNTREGKEKLRRGALQVVRDVLAKTSGGDGSGVEQIYFTAFVMQ